ncbi:hypothetical protein [Pseudomonas sp. EpS/L25]|uniref:hypothetical protein n=1 Tax=Pseudomonas sp. EpS/L25 TaxID=1749078 RepID=UPI000A7AEC9C|nr:hypothetical protein [Pseudomonas sp. EpS/L25]
MHAPLQVRRELRQLFGRWLSFSGRSHFNADQEDVVDELSILNLCQYYRLEYQGGTDDVAKLWDESEQRLEDNGPTFGELQCMGWVSYDGGRWIMPKAPIGTWSYITYPSPNTKVFLKKLGEARLVAKSDSPPPDLKALVEKIIEKRWLELKIPTKSPNWLAGRLWEQLCPKQHSATDDTSTTAKVAVQLESDTDHVSPLLDAEEEAIDRAFLEWSAWCDILGSYSRWDTSWSPLEMRYCREAAMRALQRQTLWGTWKNDTTQYYSLLKNTFKIPRDQLHYRPPSYIFSNEALVFKIDFLQRPDFEHLVMERLIGFDTANFSFALLCSELEQTDIAHNILDTATSVLSIAAEHPVALQQLLLQVRSAPGLLVDMLMHPHMSCLATRLLVEWCQESTRHDDRSLSREAQTKDFAIQDALSLVAYYLPRGAIHLAEYASLITWCHTEAYTRRRSPSDSRRPIGRTLLQLLARENEELQTALLKNLVDLASYNDNAPRACFNAVLEGLNNLPKASVSVAFPIVTLYSKFARELNLDWTDAPNLSANLAAQLIKTAFAHDAVERDKLLIPFDSLKLLRNTPTEEKPSLRHSIAKTLREHVRLLARAVASWPDEAIPPELATTLQTLISRTVIEHDEKGRIGALTDRYKPASFLKREEASPAEDIAAAWRRLSGSYQEDILQTLSISDDPVLLAELSQHLPAVAKSTIRKRLQQLKPDEASEFWTWPELQHRIESLILADETDLAREHLDAADQDLNRAPPQFRLAFFDLELRLLLKEKNWPTLDEAIIPLSLDQPTTRQAHEKLAFYKATSQLLRPNGNLKEARATLQRLAARPGAASAYRENIFAVAIQQLLGPTLQPLEGDAKITGIDLMTEINSVIATNENSASNSLIANRALLMLALQQPENALEGIATYRQERRSLDLEVIAVLSKQEMGLHTDAMAILDAAIIEFGPDDRLTTLKHDLQSGNSTPSVAQASVVQDSISSIRAALQILTELQPSQVGDILGPLGGGVRGYLIRQVSRAVASLQHMTAMLRDRKNPGEEARFENDLNTAFREVLAARLAVTKWDVADQSLGGSTANGNPGERDAVIRVSGQEISIFEALVCTSVDRRNIKAHFDKLLSYGVCDLYFHVIYSYTNRIGAILEYIEKMIEHDPPIHLTHLDCELLGPPDSEIAGYVATYRIDRREIAVAFMVVDLKH